MSAIIRPSEVFKEYTITIDTEPMTFEKVSEFIEELPISRKDMHELKSRIAEYGNKCYADGSLKTVIPCEMPQEIWNIGVDNTCNRMLDEIITRINKVASGDLQNNIQD